MRYNRPLSIAVLLTAALLLLPTAGAADDAPTVTPYPIGVDAGDTFDLEVSVLAHMNTTYNVSFAPRAHFTYPGTQWVQRDMMAGDSSLFKVPCTVDGETHNGDYNVSFKVAWMDNGTWRKVEMNLLVTVGEGTRGDDVCASTVALAAASVLGMSVLVVGRTSRKWR